MLTPVLLPSQATANNLKKKLCIFASQTVTCFPHVDERMPVKKSELDLKRINLVLGHKDVPDLF